MMDIERVEHGEKTRQEFLEELQERILSDEYAGGIAVFARDETTSLIIHGPKSLEHEIDMINCAIHALFHHKKMVLDAEAEKRQGGN